MPGSEPPGTGAAVAIVGGKPDFSASELVAPRVGVQPSEVVLEVQNVPGTVGLLPPLPSICQRKSAGSLIEPAGLPVSIAGANAPSEIDCRPFHGSPVGGTCPAFVAGGAQGPDVNVPPAKIGRASCRERV